MQRREFLRAAGATAGAVGAAAGPAAAQEDGGNQTEGGAGGGGATETVIAGPGGDLVFEPADLTIAPGTTVVWEWESDTHNVVPESQPEDANWEGVTEIHDAGFSYEHTFEVEGTYDYYCEPHRSAGMEGSIEVTTDTGGGGGGPPTVPASAMNLAIGVLGAMAATLSLAFFFIKYGGQSDDE